MTYDVTYGGVEVEPTHDDGRLWIMVFFSQIHEIGKRLKREVGRSSECLEEPVCGSTARTE